ncbi:hypothetical protein SteCoe_30752 [Stentor coeruleus]|uniref:Methyltransferase type 11 domain-containing protein n=1 Tax=Stentor coeruleus TaxID=5963 RepID=A0A1R2B3B9_9CILI|nr:hypothetical protein SteCoe_30752 [Stentor coeruleus]
MTSDIPVSLASKAVKYENFVNAYENTFELYNKLVFNLIIPLLNLELNHTLLDLGCGNGSCEELLSIQRPYINIIGIDSSKSMISRALSRLIPNTEFIQGDCLRLRFADCFFDRCVANFVINSVKNPEKLISEAFRVLKPGGIFVFSYPILKDSNDLLKILKKSLRKVKIGPKSSKIIDYSPLCQAGGFYQVRFFDTNVGVCIKSGNEACDFLAPLKDLAKIKDKELYKKVFENISEFVKTELVNGKALVIGSRIVIAYKPY